LYCAKREPGKKFWGGKPARRTDKRAPRVLKETAGRKKPKKGSTTGTVLGRHHKIGESKGNQVRHRGIRGAVTRSDHKKNKED